SMTEEKRGGLSRIADMMAVDGRFASDVVSRPHQRILMVRRGERFVTIAPAETWDEEQSLLEPTLKKVAEDAAIVVLLGRPKEVDRAALLAKGIFTLLPTDTDADGLFVAVHGAFEALETRSRAESRGKWLQRYRYELGELIEIARALTTERDLDKLLPLVLE